MYQDLTHIPVIDTHVHVFPEQISAAIRRWFEAHAWTFRSTNRSEDAIRLQFENGVSGLVLLSYAHRPGIADFLNAFTGGLLERFPHTAGLAAVHPDDPHPRRILERARDEFGLCGVKLHCHVLKRPPDDPTFFPIYEATLELDGIVTIHAGREPSIDAYGMDVRSISGADRVERVLRRFRALKMIVPHLGLDETGRFVALLQEYPNLYLDTAMVIGGYFNVAVEPGLLVRHADRILYGSDYPHIPYDMETEVRALLGLGLGEEATRKILFENAARLFPIEPRR